MFLLYICSTILFLGFFTQNTILDSDNEKDAFQTIEQAYAGFNKTYQKIKNCIADSNIKLSRNWSFWFGALWIMTAGLYVHRKQKKKLNSWLHLTPDQVYINTRHWEAKSLLVTFQVYTDTPSQLSLRCQISSRTHTNARMQKKKKKKRKFKVRFCYNFSWSMVNPEASLAFWSHTGRNFSLRTACDVESSELKWKKQIHGRGADIPPHWHDSKEERAPIGGEGRPRVVLLLHEEQKMSTFTEAACGQPESQWNVPDFHASCKLPWGRSSD